MPSPGMLRRVALVRTDVSEEPITSIISVEGIGELGKVAITNNRSKLMRSNKHTLLLRSQLRLPGTANVLS
jgi:hypothetical protein